MPFIRFMEYLGKFESLANYPASRKHFCVYFTFLGAGTALLA